MKDGGLVSKFNSIDIRLDHFHYDQFNAVILDPSLEDQDPIRMSFHICGSAKFNLFAIYHKSGNHLVKQLVFYFIFKII